MPRITVDSAGLGSYGDTRQEQTYDYDPGVVVLPVAGPTAGYKKIRLHGGLGRRVVNWQAGRAGKPPVIPSMANAGDDEFLGGHVDLSTTPNPQASGFNWNVGGTYTYVQKSPRVAGVHTFNAGGYPFPITPNDQVAAAISGPGVAAAAAAATIREKVDAFAQAVAPSADDRATDSYLWPLTLLPPQFTNDALIGG